MFGLDDDVGNSPIEDKLNAIFQQEVAKSFWLLTKQGDNQEMKRWVAKV